MANRRPSVLMTPYDHRRLMRTTQELAEQAYSLAAQLLEELRRAALCETGHLPEDVFTLNTFLTYRITGASIAQHGQKVLMTRSSGPKI